MAEGDPTPYGPGSERPVVPPPTAAAPQPGQARYADAEGRLRPDGPDPTPGEIRDPGPLGRPPEPEQPTAGPVRGRPPVALTGPPVPRPGMPDALGGGAVASGPRALAVPENQRTASVLLAAAIACTCYGLLLSLLQWKSIWWIVNTPRSPDLHPLRTDVLDVIGLVATGALMIWALIRWAPGVRRRLDAGFRVGGADWTGVGAMAVGAVLALVWFALVAVAGFGARSGELGLIPTGYRIGGLGVLLLAVGWWCVWRDRRPLPVPLHGNTASPYGPYGGPGAGPGAGPSAGRMPPTAPGPPASAQPPGPRPGDLPPGPRPRDLPPAPDPHRNTDRRPWSG